MSGGEIETPRRVSGELFTILELSDESMTVMRWPKRDAVVEALRTIRSEGKGTFPVFTDRFSDPFRWMWPR